MLHLSLTSAISQVLYRTHELRTYQFTCVTEWTGGLYASPSQPGSRSGSLIAQTWAALVSVGMDGYLAATKELMAASKKLQVESSVSSPSLLHTPFPRLGNLGKRLWERSPSSHRMGRHGLN